MPQGWGWRRYGITGAFTKWQGIRKMLDPYWNIVEAEVKRREKTTIPTYALATAKQMGLIRWLSRKLGVPIYSRVESNRQIASAFIEALKDYEHFLTLDATTQEHIRRIWRGELKHEPGPWDEGFEP